MLHGETPGRVYELKRDVMIIGRDPGCDIVLTRKFVSRRHARIVNTTGGYFLEDLESNCGTQVEGREIDRPTPLRDGLHIKIGNYTLVFNTPSFVVKNGIDSGSTILGVLDLSGSGDERSLTVKPEEKLRYILEISRSLGETLHLDEVLAKTLEVLFRIFPQADHGFVLLKSGETLEPNPRAMRFRSGLPEDLSINAPILDQVMNEEKAILSTDEMNPSASNKESKDNNRARRMTMCVPLLDPRQRPGGVIQLDNSPRRGEFTEDDLNLLAAVASQVGIAVVNARLHAALITQTQVEQEASDAREVQMALLPALRPELPGYDFWDFYEPAHFVGGDFFDYIPLPTAESSSALERPVTRWALALGDVEGKGMPAALLMARLSAQVRLFTLTIRDPTRIVERLNQDLCHAGLGDRFITFLLVLIDGENHRITIVSAGHMGPIIRRSNGRIEVIGEKDGGQPLGITASQTYQSTSTGIEPGDLVLLYTDGLVDALDHDNASFTLDHLTAAYLDAPSHCADAGEAILNAVNRHVAGTAQNDDITLLCFGRKVDRGSFGDETTSELTVPRM
jgi:serine phosphatase RsbU (regulator of sigma subunit)/pSer/pThr/pTyr-binding forkhead associated (FHA) protein